MGGGGGRENWPVKTAWIRLRACVKDQQNASQNKEWDIYGYCMLNALQFLEGS